jgi:hypothetical protein
MEWKLMQPNMAGNQGIYPNSRYVMHTIVLAGSVPLTHLKISFRELGPSMAGAAERVFANPEFGCPAPQFHYPFPP